ncbi:MAG: hypothetical protein LBD47_10690, partial [Treponema sp.]|nr:hypothetical protein [Treponema sp.]
MKTRHNRPKQMKGAFLWAISISSLLTVAVNFLILFIFRPGFVSPAEMALRIAIPGLGYILLNGFLLGRNSRAFTPQLFNDAGGKYETALKNLGSVPIKVIIFGILLELVFL